MSDIEPATGAAEGVDVGGVEGEIPERNADTMVTGLLEDDVDPDEDGLFDPENGDHDGPDSDA